MKNSVSVIIPVYNTEKYIKKCLDSIFNNTYKNIEVICIDDGSTDSTSEIIKKYQKKHKKLYLYKQKNSGPGKARNLGIIKSTGDYLLFIDSDDYIDSDYIETFIKNIEDNDVCIGGCKLLTADLKLIKNLIPKNNEWTKYQFTATCCKLYKSKFIKDNNILFYEKQNIGEDVFFNTCVYSMTNKIKSINYDGYNYIQYNESLTHNKKEKNIEYHSYYFELLKRIKINESNSKELYYFINKSLVHLTIVLAKKMNSKKLYKEYKLSKNEIMNKFKKFNVSIKYNKLETIKVNFAIILFEFLDKIHLLKFILKFI